jgi:hypothetical protein
LDFSGRGIVPGILSDYFNTAGIYTVLWSFIEGEMDGKKKCYGYFRVPGDIFPFVHGEPAIFLSQVQERMLALSCEKVILNDSVCSSGSQHGKRMSVSVSKNRPQPNLYY